MCYAVECSVCDLSGTFEEVDDILALQDRHQDRFGDHHVLEFERLSSSVGGNEEQRD